MHHGCPGDGLEDGGAFWRMRLRIVCCGSVEQRTVKNSVLCSVFESVNAAHVQLGLMETPFFTCLLHLSPGNSSWLSCYLLS